MKIIKISDEVWQEIAKRGKFGETEDDVLKRSYGLSIIDNNNNRIGNFNSCKKYATKRLSSRIQEDMLCLEFQDGISDCWILPSKINVDEIKEVRDKAVSFVKENGATIGQINAVKKTLTEAGYYVSR